MKEVAHSGFFHFLAVYEGVVVVGGFHFIFLKNTLGSDLL